MAGKVRWSTKSAARCRKEDAVMARREAPRGFERDHGHDKEQWLRHLARHPPRFCRGARRREERRAYPGPRSKNTGDDAWLFEK